MALFFLDFLSLRTDSFLDNIVPQHISVSKSLFVKAAVVGPVVCFTMATCIGAMDVLLSAGQCPVCLSHGLGTQVSYTLLVAFVWNFFRQVILVTELLFKMVTQSPLDKFGVVEM